MTKKPRDPLLAAARLILIFMMGVLAFAGAACALAAPAVVILQDRAIAELTAHGMPAETVWAIAGLLVMVAGLMALGLVFFRHLYRIVGTVGEGDPFIPVNAQRLSAMGWIVVAAHVLILPLMGLAEWISSLAKDAHMDWDFDLKGLLLALILFILARVFREGTRMREELEGTV